MKILINLTLLLWFFNGICQAQSGNLYNNVHAINSTKVQSYVPDHSKEIGDYIDWANKRHEEALSILNKLSEALRMVPVRDVDMPFFNQINSDAQQMLKAYYERVDLARVTEDVYKTYNHFIPYLKDLASAKEAEGDFIKALDSDNYNFSIDTKRKLIQYIIETSGPLTYDNNGRLVNGFKPFIIAKEVDIVKKVQSFLNNSNTNKFTVYINANGTLVYLTRNGLNAVIPVSLNKAIVDYVHNDKEINAMFEQLSILDTYFNLKGISYNDVQDLLDSHSSEFEKWYTEMQTLIGSGVNKIEAYKILYKEDLKRALYYKLFN